MTNLKVVVEEMRTMAAFLTETADSLGAYHDQQLQGVLTALGLSSPAASTVEVLTVNQKIRKEYADLPPAQRTMESRLYLARKYSLTEKQVAEILQGPVQNGALTRK